MNIIDEIDSHIDLNKAAHIYRENKLSFKDLVMFSDALASYILEKNYDAKVPIMVYGHKDSLMLVCGLACVKAGHPYVPVDISMPQNRILSILKDSNAPVIFSTSEVYPEALSEKIISREKINDIINNYLGKKPDRKYHENKEDIFYIIYTSGSTGDPKGVMISHGNLENFVCWGLSLIKDNIKEDSVFLNEAPFSFDLSVMDTYLSLVSGSTLFSTDKNMVQNLKEMFSYLKESNVDIMVATPSFAALCMSSKYFNREILNRLSVILFCGETLYPSLCKDLKSRFNDLKIINLYGPTEATVAISAIEITDEILNSYKSLPVGYVKTNNIIKISESGEILLGGDGISPGYNKEALTKKSFYKESINGKDVLFYKTGDKGYMENDLLFYGGRLDNQIKLNGFRIELEDIEKNLKNIDGIEQAVVFPALLNDSNQFLYAVIGSKNKDLKSIKIKEKLKEYLPEYMIPRRIIIRENLPLNINGKIDRKTIMEETL